MRLYAEELGDPVVVIAIAAMSRPLMAPSEPRGQPN
jgi:hypothetical protein